MAAEVVAMAEVSLLLCPFCGGVPVMPRAHLPVANQYVECQTCQATACDAEAWNRRRPFGAGKVPRFIAHAIEHYITQLEWFRETVGSEDQYWFDNDIALFRGVLKLLGTDGVQRSQRALSEREADAAGKRRDGERQAREERISSSVSPVQDEPDA